MNTLVARLFATLTVCMAAGGIVGTIAGVVYGLVRDELTNAPRPASKLLLGALILAGAGWAVVLFVVGVLFRYGVLTIALPSLVTALLTAIATVFLVDVKGVSTVGGLVGLIVGLLIGAILCELCEWLSRRRFAAR
jgi:hypothetical protein